MEPESKKVFAVASSRKSSSSEGTPPKAKTEESTPKDGSQSASSDKKTSEKSAETPTAGNAPETSKASTAASGKDRATQKDAADKTPTNPEKTPKTDTANTPPATASDKSTEPAKATGTEQGTPKTAGEKPTGEKTAATKSQDPKVTGAKPTEEKDTTPKSSDSASKTAIPAKGDPSETDEKSATETTDSKAEDTEATRSIAQSVHPVPPATSPEPQAQRGSIFLPLVLGGIIAGVIGYGAAELDLFGTTAEDPTAGLQEAIDGQNERLSALESAEAPEIPEVDLSGIESRLGEIETRLTEVEERPVITAADGVDSDQAEAYIAELERLQSSVQEQRDEMQALIDNAREAEAASTDAARRAEAQAALSKIIAALESGEPYGTPLATLEGADVSVDSALGRSAADGVPTLAALQSQFPDAARAALAASRASGTDAGEGVGGFVRQTLGIRSVEPKEGDDPDAVLSRAEAAVQSGDLNTALGELEALPDAGREAMSEWLTAAQARADARDAAAALSQSLTAD